MLRAFRAPAESGVFRDRMQLLQDRIGGRSQDAAASQADRSANARDGVGPR